MGDGPKAALVSKQTDRKVPEAGRPSPTSGASSRNVMTAEQVAERLQVDPEAIREWLRRGFLRGSMTAIQVYELEKFKSTYPGELRRAQTGGAAEPAAKGAAAPKGAGDSRKAAVAGVKKKPEPVKTASKPSPVTMMPFLVIAQMLSSIKDALNFSKPAKPKATTPATLGKPDKALPKVSKSAKDAPPEKEKESRESSGKLSSDRRKREAPPIPTPPKAPPAPPPPPPPEAQSEWQPSQDTAALSPTPAQRSASAWEAPPASEPAPDSSALPKMPRVGQESGGNRPKPAYLSLELSRSKLNLPPMPPRKVDPQPTAPPLEEKERPLDLQGERAGRPNARMEALEAQLQETWEEESSQPNWLSGSREAVPAPPPTTETPPRRNALGSPLGAPLAPPPVDPQQVVAFQQQLEEERTRTKKLQEQYQREVGSLRSTLAARDEDRAEALARIQALQSQLDSQTRAMAGHDPNALKALETQLFQAGEIHKNLRLALDGKEHELAQMRAHLQQLHQQHAASQTDRGQIRYLEEQYEQARQRCQQYQEAHAHLQREVAELRQALSSREDEKREAAQQVQKMQEMLLRNNQELASAAQGTGRLVELEQQQAAYLLEIQKLREAHQTVQRENGDLRRTLERIQQEALLLQQRAQDSADSQRLQAELEEVKVHVRQVQGQLLEARKTNQSLEQAKKVLEQQASLNQLRVLDLEQRQLENQDAPAQARKLVEVESRLQEARRAIETRDEQLELLRHQLSRTASPAPAGTPEVQDLQRKVQAMERDQGLQAERWEKELQAAGGWVGKLTEAVAAKDQRIAELEAQVAQAPGRPAGSPPESDMNAQLMAARVELNSLRRSHEVIQLASSRLENQLAEAQQENHQLRNKLTQRPSAEVDPQWVATLEAEVERSRDVIRELESEVVATIVKLAALEREKGELESELRRDRGFPR